jgi:7-keto-8-aminopelargonate synthetase-like enzyme
LIVGSRPVHTDLERALADWKQTDAAVLFPTGFAANLGVITTFGGPGTLICSDELNHASIIDGTRLARGEVAVFPHRDLDALDALLRDRAGGRRAIVVSDTVFSMDGDVADVDGLVDLCREHDALLVLDEAHAVLGPDLANPAAYVLRIGTLSKTLGALGGFVAASQPLADLVVNRARSYIFTTATTPADAAAALAAVGIVRGSEGDALRAQLRANIDALRPGHPSPIVPVVCGEEERALAAARALLEQGLLVPAIRPPTVAPGTSRLRVALSAAHSVDQVRTLAAALERLGLA